VVDDAVEERGPVDALAQQPSLHVGDRHDHRVNGAGPHLLAQLFQPVLAVHEGRGG
jgi:hypothetical protein